MTQIDNLDWCVVIQVVKIKERRLLQAFVQLRTIPRVGLHIHQPSE